MMKLHKGIYKTASDALTVQILKVYYLNDVYFKVKLIVHWNSGYSDKPENAKLYRKNISDWKPLRRDYA